MFHAPTKRGEEGVEESKTASSLVELKAELFFFVVAGEEDLAVLVEAVDEAQKGVRGRTHRREDSESRWGVKSKVRSQTSKVQTADRSGIQGGFGGLGPAASTAGGFRRRPVAGDGWFTEYVRGRLSAAFGPVKVGVKADQGQVVLLRRDVPIGIVEAQPRPLGSLADRKQVFRLKPNRRDCSGNKEVLHETNESGMELPPQEQNPDGVDAEFGDKQRFVGNDAQEALDIVGPLLVQQELEEDVRVKLIGQRLPPLADLVLKFNRGVLVAHVPKKTPPVEAHLADWSLCPSSPERFRVVPDALLQVFRQRTGVFNYLIECLHSLPQFSESI